MTDATPRIIVLAAMGFVAAFLLGGWLTGTVGGAGWGVSLAMAAALGIAGAGLQLLLLAVRRREQLEHPEG
ncbi:hypothetical protein [Raineyella sp. W15-4]|uniref:hypothetical protein n=1 Tax=Raineyella sp. W15-4 TaxID=3081651 RepID=UPI0029542581|nr:hypothetical protein [Raineyella sp. W15-4]WOQ17675.1 hypothetical protein R0145_02890 [Raineyella sp. W15-4]